MNALKPGTPLPWEVLSWANPYESHDHRQVKIVRYAEDGGKSWVAECSGGSFYYHEGTEANAAYIVTACNAYPDLVEALQAMFDRHKLMAGYGSPIERQALVMSWVDHMSELGYLDPLEAEMATPDKLAGEFLNFAYEIARAALKKARGDA